MSFLSYNLHIKQLNYETEKEINLNILKDHLDKKKKRFFVYFKYFKYKTMLVVIVIEQYII